MASNTKKIYALKAAANKGKTATLLALYALLIDKKRFPNAKATRHFGEKEIIATIENVNGHTVGLSSYGDPDNTWDKLDYYFGDGKCDIIFCACRTRGITVDEVNRLAKKCGYEVKFVKKDTEESAAKQENVNKAQAEGLLDYVRK